MFTVKTLTLSHFFIKWFDHIGSIDFWKVFPFSWNLFVQFFCFLDTINSFLIVANRRVACFHHAFQCLNSFLKTCMFQKTLWFIAYERAGSTKLRTVRKGPGSPRIVPGSMGFLNSHASSGEKDVEIVKTLHVKFFHFGSAEPVWSVTVKVTWPE